MISHKKAQKAPKKKAKTFMCLLPFCGWSFVANFAEL
jgi:hypothetical protein